MSNAVAECIVTIVGDEFKIAAVGRAQLGAGEVALVVANDRGAVAGVVITDRRRRDCRRPSGS
jgi:hypothetical protein